MRPLILAAASCVLAACTREGAPGGHAQAPAAPPSQAVPASATPAALATPPAPTGADFTDEVRLLYRVVACGGDDALPAGLDAATVDGYCRWLRPKLATYEKSYVAKARPFLAERRPNDLPRSVVYPFGGGDLLTALLTYPEGLEFTTLSLEHAGDPRRLKDLDKARLAQNLAEVQRRMVGLFTYAESTSENLMQLEKSDIPGQLSFFVVALAAYGYEPVSLRYFRLEPDGGIRHLTAEDIAGEGKTKAQRLNKVWVSPEFSVSFSNSELVFKPRGKEGPLHVHRHIAVNLSDANLRKDPSVLKHLEAKGKVAAMTKAASYLLWAEGFSKIRGYLLDHMAFMVSDSTGVPPSAAAKAGFEMETYGKFSGPFLAARPQVAQEFKKLWASQPYRKLDFRYGYPDASGQHHLVITRPKAKDEPKDAGKTAASAGR